VLAADPDSRFSFDYANMDDNTFQVNQYEDDDADAWTVIMDVVNIGDASDNRWIFGIYNDRKAHYTAVPTDIEYRSQLTDESQKIIQGGGEIFPWSVRAGKWLFMDDFLVGQPQSTTLRKDQRAVFAETVAYTAPWGLKVNGVKVNKLAQILAKQQMGA
jgi:hypothetical protein